MQSNYLDTKGLIKKCISNDAGAQSEMYNRFAPKMLSVCYRYASSKNDAEDIFQEGFLKVFENLNQLKNYNLLERWMKKIFINEALKLYNNNKQIYLVDNLSLLGGVANAEYDVLNRLATDEILLLIQDLPHKMRMVFNMYVIEGYSHSEIAAILNISEGTSKSNLHDARKKLQRKIFELEKLKLLG